MQVQPYMMFEGRCDEAIEYYKKALGAKVNMLMRYKECPDPNAKISPGSENKVMHASIQVGDSTVLMSDGHCSGKTDFNGVTLTLIVGSDAEAGRVFTALADGGKVTMPLSKTFFSSQFGMLDDRFGMSWMVYVAA